jgi:pyridoxal phosphate enzyme (YggS family)
MTQITENYLAIEKSIPDHVKLVAVSKFHPVEAIKEVYDAGQRIFGENRVQEMVEKKPLLPDDIEWHLIGTLQTNKVKYIAPFVTLIHSVDSPKLLAEIDKQAKKNNRIIDCLLEVFIAKEETKHGFSLQEADEFLNSFSSSALSLSPYPSVRIVGLMGMATNTDNAIQVRQEFKKLAELYKKHQRALGLKYLSMGMTSDYKLAIKEGSTMVRVGSAIFGERASKLNQSL